ncbi:cation:proton antiporter [Tissierella sp. MB52-C2]|uniref:cation:proton antiporter n=1 Tax=Tissierella sp. MB52-C2 TaxID=3070999 RepID=UPI00280A5FED|nr:cation:proton antiporter [Tissierella sp. MB52-C2]WMM23848.1 cation:proton antiporter [Tissierella sp. MB52-C2]
MFRLDLLFKLGIIILVGIVGGRIANFFKLPNVSGYIVAGLIIGPSFINLVNEMDIEAFNIINEMALAAIAFSIGNEFLLKDMKKVGKDVLLITVAEVVGAFVVVFIMMYFVLNQSIEFSLMISSMSAATAPAGIVMVIRELKANGPLTKTILPIVALDDALGIMVFGVCLSLSKILSGVEEYSIIKIISNPTIEIFGSIVLGFVIGIVMTYVVKKAKHNEELLIIIIGFILLSSGAANYFNLSPLLTCMMVGATLVNLKQNSFRVFNLINEFTPPVNLLFFTVAGASLNIKVLSTVGILGIGYIIARAGGKYIGATLGAKAVGAEEKIVKYLGMSLLTQGGISIGLSMIVRKELPELSSSIITVILFSVLIYEIVGPILAKIAITKAGEVNGMLKKEKKKEQTA